MGRRDLWLQMCVPPREDMIRHLQDAALGFAGRCGFEKADGDRIALAIEEAFCMVLHYSYQGEDVDGELGCRVYIAPPVLRVELVDHGAPFDLSMIPGYELGELPNADLETMCPALSYHLLKHSVDQLRIVNDGRSGIRLEMSWFLPGDSIVEQGETLGEENAEPSGEVESEEWIGELGPEHAIQVARLVHQGYGYSYVYEDVYFPSRIHSHYEAGTLRSLGGVTGSGRLVGHLALMRDAANVSAVEWGLVVVDPAWRGRRIMERLLAAAEKTVCARGENVFYAHAVTAHPYTQKACERFGFYPTALLVCYAPATMSFRGINPQLKQRESTFIAVRLMQRLPPATLYFPKAHAEMIQLIFQGLGVTPGEGIRFCDLEENRASEAALTRYSSSMITSVNGANIVIEQAGEDGDLVVHHEWRRLCNERIDVIYLTVNLEDAGAARVIRAAKARGFFFAGVTPQVMGIPYGLTLQFMNNLKIEAEAIHAFDGAWHHLKAYVMRDKARVEGE